MTKVTVNISPKDWGNLITKYSADSKKLSNADFTNGTVNGDTDVTGNITKRQGGPKYNPIALASAPKDQYEAIFSDGARHLLVVANGTLVYSSGDTVFNSVVNGSGFSTGANFEFVTTQDRVYMGNGINASQVYDRNTNYGGVAYSAPRLKAMGAQAPASAPTVAAATAGGAVPIGNHTYKVTFLYYESEESNGGPASALATATAGFQTIPLSAIPVGGYGVIARKIYRDNTDGLWLHIATIADNTTTVFNDNIAVGLTPTEIPTDNGLPPLFAQITLWLDRIWAAQVPGDPYTLFYSEPGFPDIFPSANQILCNQEDPITAFVVYYDRLIVFNRRSMGQILGKTSDTFRYAKIPGSIGCVDSRTLQTRVIEGVPILIWLSDRGFYTYDGNSVNYISDWIENLVNFNIQQAIQQKNSNTQSSQAQFTSGTSSPGIDLTSNPGAITTKGFLEGSSVVGTNPRRDWNEQSDWEAAGTSNTNTATRDGTNTVKVPTIFQPASAAGTLSGQAIIASGTAQLPTTADFTGDSKTGTYNPGILNVDTSPPGIDDLATPIMVPRNGTITSFTFTVKMQSGVATFHPRNETVAMEIWSDAGGQPGGQLYNTAQTVVFPAQFPAFEFTLTTGAISYVLSAGIRYWLVIRLAPNVPSGSSVLIITNAKITNVQYGDAGPYSMGRKDNGAWANLEHNGTNDPIGLAAGSYTFTPSVSARSGTWLSNIFDSKSVFVGSGVGASVNALSIGAAGFGAQTATLRIEGSNDGVTFDQTQDYVLVNGLNTLSVSFPGRRYWRFRILLSSGDDRYTPQVRIDFSSATQITLRFNIVATWISEAIDMTADVTVYDFLTVISTVPSGTSIAVTIATSADNLTYTSFVSFGSHVVQRYAKIRVILTAKTDDSESPTLTSISFGWTLVSNLISSGIDTAVTPPAGWDIFLSSFVSNGGVVQFQMRSATTLGGLTAATFQNVTVNDFPSAVTPLQFVQWKVILTSSNNAVPIIDSVTVQWFIGTAISIRPASIFVDSRYYVALAEVNQTFNNILLEFDSDGKWRQIDGLFVNTFSFFFNRPYLGLATAGTIRKFLEGTTDDGAAITLDVRTKAFDFSTTEYDNYSDRMKAVGEFILEGKGTGAAYQVFYSLDLGVTFINLLTDSGGTTYTSPTGGDNFYARFKPSWEGNFTGRRIMYRVLNTDINEVEIIKMKATAIVLEREPVVTG